MLRTGVDFKFLDHSATQLVAWQHALDCVLDDELRLLLAHVLYIDVAVSTHPSGVEHVSLVCVLFAGELDLLSIHYDDEVARVSVRRVGRLMTAAEHVGNFYGYATKCFIGSIDHIP